MHFVHIIEINDPRNPLIEALTREQIWRGLLRRAERPMDFLPQLNSCSIVMRGDRTIARELNFGSFVVRDRVRLIPMEQLTFDTEAAPNVPAGKLTIAIEELHAHRLQLRFTYDIDHQHMQGMATKDEYDRLLQSAYLQADIDCVRIIRQLIADGGI